jgi:cytochrome c biogenesis protein ResB
MMLGLFVSFCLAHRRIWVRVTAGAKQGSTILICGVSSKNRPAFEQRFQKLVDDIGKDVGS